MYTETRSSIGSRSTRNEAKGRGPGPGQTSAKPDLGLASVWPGLSLAWPESGLVLAWSGQVLAWYWPGPDLVSTSGLDSARS